MNSGLEGVQAIKARISQIEALVAQRRLTASAAASSSASGSSFSSALQRAAATGDPNADLSWNGPLVGAQAAAAEVPASTPYGDLFNAAGKKYGIAPKLLAAVAKTESGFNPQAVSPAGAVGLMQFMPATAAGMGVNALDPASAIDGAARMLSSSAESYGSVQMALAAYNVGAGTLQRLGGLGGADGYVAKVLSYLK